MWSQALMIVVEPHLPVHNMNTFMLHMMPHGGNETRNPSATNASINAGGHPEFYQ
jgi:hypothetical protein